MITYAGVLSYHGKRPVTASNESTFMRIFAAAAIINRSLFGSRRVDYQQVEALRLLAEERVVSLDGAALIRSLYGHTIKRWRDATGRVPRWASAQNWRFTLNTGISDPSERERGL